MDPLAAAEIRGEVVTAHFGARTPPPGGTTIAAPGFQRYLVVEDQLLTGSGKLTLRQSRQRVVADFGRHICCLENILGRGDHIL